MNDQWSEILESYHLPSCSEGADRMECTCRLWEVIKGVAQLEAEIGILRETKSIAEEFASIGAAEVHRVWRDVMIEQARTVGPERMDWRNLPAQDKELDKQIASAVVADFLVWFFAHKALGDE